MSATYAVRNPTNVRFFLRFTAEHAYNRMVVQLEYCAEILEDLHTGMDFIFLFDHPFEHGRGREHSLNVMNINRGYSWTQQEVHLKQINQEVGYLVLHEIIIAVGDENHMVFQEGSDSSLWMTPQERVATKFSQYDEL